MANDPTPLEARIHDIADMIAEPAAPGTQTRGDEEGRDDKGVVSLLYPSPDIAGDQTKWDLARKNILTRLDEAEGLDRRAVAKLQAWVEQTDQKDLPEGGFALYSDGERLSALTLDVRPAPTLHSGAIYALPALVDAAEQRAYWTVVLDVEAPKLFRVEGGTWKDETPAEVRTLSGEMGRTEPMAAVTFHSSGRPHIGSASHASAKFHALGTASTDLKAEEVGRVLTHFAGQVEDIVSGTKDPILLAGDPKRCGLFRQHFDNPQLLEEDLHVAGDALELRELAGRAREAIEARMDERLADEMRALDRNTLTTRTDELLSAAREGRVEHVYLRADAAGLLPGDDERLKLGAMEDEGAEARSMIVAHALKNGAGLTVFEEEQADDLSELSATMRY